MKKSLPYPVILGITLALFVANVLPLFLFRNQIQITIRALPSAVFLFLHLGTILRAFLVKHKGAAPFLLFRSLSLRTWWEDKEYTFTPAFEREFRFLLLVHCVSAPFYIPLAFFLPTLGSIVCPAALFFLPQAVVFATILYKAYATAKREKERDEALAHERILQERREEQGRWK